ncbi:MAG TPA: DUF4198 domain-containing protein [Chitinophagaceae bacterium]|nr:DUF4198 domain-containing protein [Chitinophagaceae bacterium]
MIKTILFLAFTVTQGFFSPGKYWLLPDTFYYKWGEPSIIKLMNGHTLPGKNWTGQKEQLQNLTIRYSNVSDDLSDALGSETGDSIRLMILDEGTAMVTCSFTSNWINPDLSGEDIHPQGNAPSDSMTTEATNDSVNVSASMNWQENLKTIFQVGTDFTKTYLEKTGLPIDIIPLMNPYQVNETDTLAFSIYYKETLLANVPVEVWHFNLGDCLKTSLSTDANGQIRFPVIKSGTWMISCTKIDSRTDSTNSSRLNYRGSCTWGYE